MYVLRTLQIVEIRSCSLFSTILKLIHGSGDYPRAHVLNSRLSSGTQSDHHKNRKHHEQSLRRPERQKNLEKKASHFLPFTDGRANMYPTPRIVLMWSPLSSESPSFRRTLLTCMSMLRSNGMNLRLRTAFTNRSRVTTRPAPATALRAD